MTSLLKQHAVSLSVDLHRGVKCISINDHASLVTDCAGCGEGHTRRAVAAGSTRPATSSASYYRKPAASFSWVTLIHIIIILITITVTVVVVVVMVVVVNNCLNGTEHLRSAIYRATAWFLRSAAVQAHN